MRLTDLGRELLRDLNPPQTTQADLPEGLRLGEGELYYVVRHSGRRGHKWRCVFASDSWDEAYDDYLGRLPTKPINYAVTEIRIGRSSRWGRKVRGSGFDPEPVGQSAEDPLADLRAREAMQKRKHRSMRGTLRLAPLPARIEAEPSCLRIA